MSKQKILFVLTVILAIFLRFTWISSIPASLYTDEVSQGYNAFSLLKTQKDEYGTFLPVSLRSFGDWKPPMQTYLMVPAISIFGLNEFAVRLPSAILGIGSIVLAYAICKELFETKVKEKIALLTAFLLAISPWHVLQSRSAMLVIVALFFLEAGIYAFLKGRQKKGYLILSASMFIASIYSYYGSRVVVPLVILLLVFVYRKYMVARKTEVGIAIVVSFVLMLPLFFGFFHDQNILLGRAKTVSIFYDKGVSARQWELISQDGISADTKITLFFHNKYLLYGKEVFKRFVSHLDLKFLFFEGDKANPFQISAMGVLYIQEAVYLLIGLIYLKRAKEKGTYVVLGWICISIIPAAFTFLTPSSNRIFNMIVPLMIISSVGIVYILKSKYRRIFSGVMVVTYIISFHVFLHQYFIVMPKVYPEWWAYKLSEVGKYLTKNNTKYKNIVIISEKSMFHPYILFYSKYNPQKLQNEIIRTNIPDEVGFEHVDSFGKYIFYDDLTWNELKDSMLPDTLYTVPSSQTENKAENKKRITYPNGTTSYIFIDESDLK